MNELIEVLNRLPYILKILGLIYIVLYVLFGFIYVFHVIKLIKKAREQTPGLLEKYMVTSYLSPFIVGGNQLGFIKLLFSKDLEKLADSGLGKTKIKAQISFLVLRFSI